MSSPSFRGDGATGKEQIGSEPMCVWQAVLRLSLWVEKGRWHDPYNAISVGGCLQSC